MTRDGEIPAIFNPKRVRTPSVVVTGDSPNGPYDGFTNILNTGSTQIAHQDSVSSSQQDPNEVITIPDGCPLPSTHASGRGASGSFSGPIGASSGGGAGGGTGGGANDSESPTPEAGAESGQVRFKRLKACKESCCSELAQKIYFGICVTCLVTLSWVGATHSIKFLYKNKLFQVESTSEELDLAISQGAGDLDYVTNMQNLLNGVSLPIGEADLAVTEEDATKLFHVPSEPNPPAAVFNAPFFAAWFFTNFLFLFFPIYVLGRVSLRKCDKPGEILGDVLRGFRDRGFTIGRFLNRCLSFCILWLITTYLYTLSLRVLYATDAMALFATNVSCVYLLSWVILHEQFVGVRIVAVILCDTGIALLAYMDGITESPTLSGVVLATLGAAGYAVFRVMFRKVMGDPPVGQIAFAFTTLGFLNALLLWPVCVGLYLTGTETMPASCLCWIFLLAASILLLVFHILMQFSAAVTYNMFVTLGLITAVPASAALDIAYNSAKFAGMNLAGIILISVGFFLVMFPENWPDYITRLLRKSGRAILRYQCCCDVSELHFSHSKYHLVGSQRESSGILQTGCCGRSAADTMGTRASERFASRSASYNHRLSDGIHKVPSSIALWPCEMTDLSPTGFLYHHQNPNQHHQLHLHHSQHHHLHQQQQQQQHQHQLSTFSLSSGQHSIGSAGGGGGGGGGSSSGGGGGGGGGGRLFSYFGNEHERERKKSETSFFNLGFRRKSTVVYYAATD